MKRRRTRCRSVTFILPVAIALSAGCRGAFDVGQRRTGSLTVSVPEMGPAMLVPPISMEPISYDVIGSGPDEASFMRILEGSPGVTVTGLALGEWTVVVTARNHEGTAIGDGSGAATVEHAATTTVFITVRSFGVTRPTLRRCRSTLPVSRTTRWSSTCS